MRLRVRHATRYSYGEPVATSHHEAHLVPRDSQGALVLESSVDIQPRPIHRRERRDFFGNHTLTFSLHEPHEQLDVVATSLVDNQRPAPPDLDASPSWEAIRDQMATMRSQEGLAAYGLCFPSTRTASTRAVREYARPSFQPGRPVLQVARELTARIHRDFKYDPEATGVFTPVDEVLTDRRGVCQDFAHLQIACLRAFGLPARYVSGYLLTRPPPGHTKLVGADASHAWLSVYLPDHGWVDFDPTNDLLPGDEHVTAAYGRDFGDVTPLKGVILGGGAHEVIVGVDVEVLS